MSKLNVEANILALCKETGIKPIYEIEAAEPRDPEPEDNAERSPLANFGEIEDANAYIATLDDATRAHSDLPRKALGPVYFVTDTAVEAARQRGLPGLAELLEHLQGLRPFNVADGQYTISAGSYAQPGGPGTDFVGDMVHPWPNTRVFGKGVTDDQVLGYVKQRVADNANTNPDQDFPGKKG